MKSSIRLGIAALAATAIGMLGALSPTTAALFDKQEVDNSRFIAVSAPRGRDGHQLLLLEQISDTQQCWGENGASPTAIEPLLLNFDFTGICGRATDSNGYSIRMADEDLALKYSLRVVERDNDLVLIGVSNDRRSPSVEIGRAFGIGTTDFTKLNLNPGWRFTKRTFDGKVLGHVYLTHDLTLAEVTNSPIPVVTRPEPDPIATRPTFSFSDVAGDIYADEIQQAVTLGFIAGFPEDNTFRPKVTLTREQLVSIVVEALRRRPGSTVQLTNQVPANPYPDVPAGRWSAAKIKFARDSQIVSGYPDGTFKPQQTVTRAELIAVLRRAAEFSQQAEGLNPNLTLTQTPVTFSDTSNHWSAQLASQMSAYCGVASPLNEIGNSFGPDVQAQRNYAAAGSIRLLNCLNQEQS
ncbi:MAG: DUF3747 domain-containing protein [Cyanothece sp. SIO1E1]|nr:DUF3747 domain-containing protein [Cyanothece sp. SIO1E1]